MIGMTISHYKILEELGGGGMGIVYKAEDIRLKRNVALKFLPQDLTRDKTAKQRFIKEAQTASSLDHPNICNIHEIDETEEGQLFICMACYEGETLKKIIEKGQMEIDRIIDIAMQLAHGLEKAHSQEIIHRDIKPANIFITNDGQAKILDFGLAKLVGKSSLTKTGTATGTVAYMSPEQASGEEVNYQTDIWSLGVVLYEMTSGHQPFKGETWEAVVYAILNTKPPQIRLARPEAPEALQIITKRMLQKNPSQRYKNVDELLKDLKAVKNKTTLAAASTTDKERPSASIAVLPFLDMSPGKDQEYFCDGMAEELINSLTHIKDLRVVARTSAFSFKGKNLDIRDIGRKLNVDTVLEGSVRKAGNRLRITTQLIEVFEGYHLWSEKYDLVMNDVFAIQDEITLSIVDKLRVQLLGSEKEAILKRYTENLEAYNFYLKGRFFTDKMTADGLRTAINYFKQAIDQDASYALAHTGLADGYGLLGFYDYMHPKEALARARMAASKALEIDPALAEAHNSRGFVRLFYDWDWHAAEKDFKKAIELNPHYTPAHTWYAFYFAATGNLDKAIREDKTALELDPLSITANVTLGTLYLRANQLEQARVSFLKALEMDPNLVKTHSTLGQTYILESKYDKGLAEHEKAVNLSKRHPWNLAGLGWAYARAGRKKEALELITELESRRKTEYIRPYYFAKIYAGMAEKDHAFYWLDQAFEEHDMSLVHILSDETMSTLRSDPRFNQLVKKMGLGK
ncbi:MAG: protein kinase [candidate division WOR-3 bacterium]|nr:MAG: protein kinase [candidate division WOR-3 bacterium]